jgi:hypothetical protein
MKANLFILALFCISLLVSCSDDEHINTNTKVNFWLESWDSEYEINEFQFLLEDEGKEEWITPESFQSGIFTCANDESYRFSLIAQERNYHGTITKIKIKLGNDNVYFHYDNSVEGGKQYFDLTIDENLNQIIELYSPIKLEAGKVQAIKITPVFKTLAWSKVRLEDFLVRYNHETMITYVNSNDRNYAVEYEQLSNEWGTSSRSGRSKGEPSLNYLFLGNEGEYNVKIRYSDSEEVLLEYESIFIEQGEIYDLGKINLDEIVNNKSEK